MGFGPRLVLWISIVVLVVLTLAGAIGIKLLEVAQETVLESQARDVRGAASRVERRLAAVRRLALGFSGTAPVEHLLAKEAVDAPPEVWRGRLEQIFASSLETNNGLVNQLRLLDRSGTEVVRVQSDRSGHARITEPSALQDKSARTYFVESSLRGDREIWTSEMNLNREGGGLVIPYRPVVRIFVPIRFDGEFAGLVVVNVSAKVLFQHALQDVAGEVFVSDQAGWFLHHADRRKEFGHQLGTEHRVDREFRSDVVDALDRSDAAFWDRTDDKVYIAQPVAFGGEESPQMWTLLVTRDGSAVFELIRDIRYALLFGLLLMGAFLLLLVNWVVRRLAVRPIVRLADLTRRVVEGDNLLAQAELPERHDELREVYSSIQEFASTKQALEQTVEDRTAEVRALVRSVPEAIVAVDADGRIESFNRAASEIFGWTLEEAIGQEVSMLFQDASAAAGAADGASMAKASMRIDLQGVRKSGEKFPIEVRSSLYEVGGRVLRTWLMSDISARRQAENEAAAREKALELSAMLSRTEVLIAELFQDQRERKGALSEVLRLLNHELGWQPTTFYAWDPTKQLLVREVDGNAQTDGHATVALGEGLVGTTADGSETVFIAGDETMPFWLDTGVGRIPLKELACVPLRKHEKLLGVLVVGTVTPFGEKGVTLLEAVAKSVASGLTELAQYKQLRELSQELKQRGQEILRKNAHLERANRLKSQFLATMSHELRTPLNAIIGFSEALSEELVGPINPEQKEYSQEILQAGEHLLALINDILDLSKIEAGKLSVEPEVVELRPLLENAFAIVRGRASDKDLKLKYEIAPEAQTIFADPRKLRQIAYNYLSNAVKFTPEAGTVKVAVEALDDFVEIRVTDSGIGIAQTDFERVFAPFEQIDSKLSRRYEGTGLGLAMVKSLTELHGGTVGVRSKPGKGSTFWARFPRRSKSEHPASETGRRKRASDKRRTRARSRTSLLRVDDSDAKKTHVLVIEDDVGDRQLLELYLRSAGFAATGVGSVADAHESLRERKPSLIVLDLGLPDVDGFAFLTDSVDSELLRGVPIVVVTGIDSPERAISLGADALLQKPVRKYQLLDEVQRLLAKKVRPLVLIVDADEETRGLVANYFKEENCTVRMASSGAEAMALMERIVPDLLILDLAMPTMTGFDVMAQMHERPSLSGVCVVAMTAKDLTDVEEKYLAEHVLHVFHKSELDLMQFVSV